MSHEWLIHCWLTHNWLTHCWLTHNWLTIFLLTNIDPHTIDSLIVDWLQWLTHYIEYVMMASECDVFNNITRTVANKTLAVW